MRNFIKKIIVVLFPAFLLLISINFFGDAAHLFSDKYYTKMAAYLKKGYNITNVENYNERILQKKIIVDHRPCPDVAVIGSSRLMLINSSYFPNQVFFNNSVTGASLQDIIAIIGLYDEKGCFPKKIIMGIDPWMLNAKNGSHRWKTLYDEYNSMNSKILNKVDETKGGFSNKLKMFLAKNSFYKELISPSYFQNSLVSITSSDPDLKPTNLTVNNTFTKLSDGSITYDLKYRSASEEEIALKVDEYIINSIYGIENFNELNTNLQLKLEALTAFLIKKGVEVEFILLPYHPKVYSFISSKEKYINVKNSEDYIKKFALQNKLIVRGSFNPEYGKVQSSDFYDGMHLNERGIDKMMLLNK